MALLFPSSLSFLLSGSKMRNMLRVGAVGQVNHALTCCDCGAAAKSLTVNAEDKPWGLRQRLLGTFFCLFALDTGCYLLRTRRFL